MAGQPSLTAESVDSLEPPLSGERWIADSQVKGFGLRLWSNRSGGSKAFAIRVSNKDGMVIRRTYDLAQSSAFRHSALRNVPSYRLGDSLGDARAWAKDEIAKLHGRMTRA